MRKKIFFSIAILICMFASTGCADEMPDLTEEQQNIIAEYSAQQLLKYCSYYDSGIAEEALLQEMEEETLVPEQTEEAVSEETQTMDVQPDEQQSTDSEAEAVAMIDAAEADLAELLGQDEFAITYDHYEVGTSYPQDDSAYFSMDAPQGRQFLILFFSIENMSSDAAEIDLLSTDVGYRVNLNETGYKSNLSTLLMDDLSTIVDGFEGNETKQAVLILQVDDADVASIDSIALQVEMAGVTSRIKLY